MADQRKDRDLPKRAWLIAGKNPRSQKLWIMTATGCCRIVGVIGDTGTRAGIETLGNLQLDKCVEEFMHKRFALFERIAGVRVGNSLYRT
jgi:hypothetical protein